MAAGEHCFRTPAWIRRGLSTATGGVMVAVAVWIAAEGLGGWRWLGTAAVLALLAASVAGTLGRAHRPRLEGSTS